MDTKTCYTSMVRGVLYCSHYPVNEKLVKQQLCRLYLDRRQAHVCDDIPAKPFLQFLRVSGKNVSVYREMIMSCLA